MYRFIYQCKRAFKRPSHISKRVQINGHYKRNNIFSLAVVRHMCYGRRVFYDCYFSPRSGDHPSGRQ